MSILSWYSQLTWLRLDNYRFVTGLTNYIVRQFFGHRWFPAASAWNRGGWFVRFFCVRDLCRWWMVISIVGFVGLVRQSSGWIHWGGRYLVDTEWSLAQAAGPVAPSPDRAVVLKLLWCGLGFSWLFLMGYWLCMICSCSVLRLCLKTKACLSDVVVVLRKHGYQWVSACALVPRVILNLAVMVLAVYVSLHCICVAYAGHQVPVWCR